MGVPSVKHHASLETYSKRVIKSRKTYQRRRNADLEQHCDTSLPRAAGLPISPSDHRQADQLPTDNSPSRLGRRHALRKVDPWQAPRGRSELQASEQNPSPSAISSRKTRQKPHTRETYSPTPNTTAREPSIRNPGSSKHKGEIAQLAQDPTALERPAPSEAPKKRKRGDQTVPQDGSPTLKRSKQSITNYFKPLPQSSSPLATSTSPRDSPDTFKSRTSTPPSSPPSTTGSPVPYKRKYQKRRLTTKTSLPPITMSADIQYGKFEDDEDTISFAEAVGDTTDENRAEIAEQALDREDARDTILSASFPISRAVYLASCSDRLGLTTRRRSNTSSANRSTETTEEAKSNRTRSKTLIAISPEARSQPISIPPSKPPNYKQMYFDLPHDDSYIQCKECDKYYDPNNPRSKKKHDIHHEKRLHSKVTKKETSTIILEEWARHDKQHRIVVIDCRQAIAVRSHAQAVLGVTSETLGPIHVEKDELWCMIPDPQSKSSRPALVPRFRVFVHYINDEAVSVILAERVKDGCPYRPGRVISRDESPPPDEPGSYYPPGFTMEPQLTYPVWVSIERIWVREGHRRNGYATKMVDLVRSNCILGLPLRKHQIAFSCPFGSGVDFATEYCRGVFPDAPFMVNSDEIFN